MNQTFNSFLRQDGNLNIFGGNNSYVSEPEKIVEIRHVNEDGTANRHILGHGIWIQTVDVIVISVHTCGLVNVYSAAIIARPNEFIDKTLRDGDGIGFEIILSKDLESQGTNSENRENVEARGLKGSVMVFLKDL
jgi:hypothetical protein